MRLCTIFNRCTPFFSSGHYMAIKKSKANEKRKKSKKTSSSLTKKSSPKIKSKGKKSKNTESGDDDAGIVVIDEDLEVDKNAELEARQAYLEEARSQEAFD